MTQLEKFRQLAGLRNLHEKAMAAAVEAARAANARLGDENCRGLDCGFAWVNAPEVRGNTRLGKELKALGFRKSWTKGQYLWMTGCAPTQSISVHEAAARAYVKAMEGSGVKFTVGSRLD